MSFEFHRQNYHAENTAMQLQRSAENGKCATFDTSYISESISISEVFVRYHTLSVLLVFHSETLESIRLKLDLTTIILYYSWFCQYWL